jgi:conjugative transposon TraJ protein
MMGALLAGTVIMFLPAVVCAQGTAGSVSGLHGVLDHLYDQMIPLCSRLISVGRGIAGFAAIWYIASRVWRHIARAEPIDFYPLFRPFVLGFCVMIFPSVLAMINGVLQPTVTATAAMVEGSDKAITVLLKEKEDAVKQTDAWQMYVGATGSGNRDRWYKYTHDGADPSGEGLFQGIGDDVKFALAKASYNFRNSVKEWMSEVLEILFEAASLCIDTLRTFQLIVLAILGPLVFGLAVFDGFQHTLTAWLARYINIFLWLPVANIFGSIIGQIQEKMLEIDIAQLQSQGDTFFSSTDTAYLVFLVIGIIGYFTVPSVANYIVHAGGFGALHYRTNSLFYQSSRVSVNTASHGAGMAADAMGHGAGRIAGAVAGAGASPSFSGAASSHGSGYMEDRLRGNG